jgi:hypothetical protein
MKLNLPASSQLECEAQIPLQPAKWTQENEQSSMAIHASRDPVPKAMKQYKLWWCQQITTPLTLYSVDHTISENLH